MDTLPNSSLSPEDYKALKSQLDFFRLIVSQMSEGVFLVRVKDEVIVYANPKFESIFGYGSGELNGLPCTVLNFETQERSSVQTVKEVIDVLNKHGKAVYDLVRVKKNGTPFWSRSHTTQFDHPEFGLVWVAVLEDISQQRETEKYISISDANAAKEAERARISGEIHDELGQLLTVLKFNLSSLKNENACEIDASIDHIIKIVRRIAFDLKTSTSDSQGLEEKVKSLVDELKSKTGRNINLKLSLKENEVDREIATALFRILQESLTNSLRHSDSEKVDINLIKTEFGYDLTIRDYYGPNFKFISYRSKDDNIGVRGMRARAMSLGGNFSIKNEGGTIVRVNLPEKARS